MFLIHLVIHYTPRAATVPSLRTHKSGWCRSKTRGWLRASDLNALAPYARSNEWRVAAGGRARVHGNEDGSQTTSTIALSDGFQKKGSETRLC